MLKLGTYSLALLNIYKSAGKSHTRRPGRVLSCQPHEVSDVLACNPSPSNFNGAGNDPLNWKISKQSQPYTLARANEPETKKYIIFRSKEIECGFVIMRKLCVANNTKVILPTLPGEWLVCWLILVGKLFATLCSWVRYGLGI